MTGLTTALMGLFIFTSMAASPSTLAASQLPGQSYLVTITGYNAVPAQTKPDPTYTASGAYSNPAIVAARSIDLADSLPFGTVIAIEPTDTSSPGCGYPLVADSIGLRVIADSMNPRMHNKVDLLFGNHNDVNVGGTSKNAAIALGSCPNVRIRVVGHVSINQIPKTQSELAAAAGLISSRYASAN